MKKLLIAVLSFTFLSANAQTVDEVIQKYAAKLGGLEAFNKTKTLKITATFSTQGMDLPMTVQIINGKAYRTDVEAMGSKVIRAYKDGKAWTQNPFAGTPSPTEVTGPELNEYKDQTMLASPLMDYKARGNSVELIGQFDVEGIKTFKIKLTPKNDNRPIHYYVSTTDYTLIKSEIDREMQGQTMTVETLYSDLKDFGGLKFFMNRDQKINGEVFQSTKYTNVELNVTIDEKIFDKPVQ